MIATTEPPYDADLIPYSEIKDKLYFFTADFISSVINTINLHLYKSPNAKTTFFVDKKFKDQLNILEKLVIYHNDLSRLPDVQSIVKEINTSHDVAADLTYSGEQHCFYIETPDRSIDFYIGPFTLKQDFGNEEAELIPRLRPTVPDDTLFKKS